MAGTTTVLTPYQTMTSGIEVGSHDQFFRVRDLDPEIHELNQDDGIFYKVLQGMPNDAPAINPRYEWAYDDIPANQTRVNYGAGYAAGDVSIVVDDSLGIVANSLLYNTRTRELMYVGAAPTYATHTVASLTRGFAGTAAAAILDNDELTFLGDQLPELADANGGNGSVPAQDYNYIQRWSKTFRVSHLQEQTEMIGNVGQVPRESVRKMLEMKRQINASLIYGKKGKVVSPISSDDGYVYTTNGFVNYITTNELNVSDIGGHLSWPVLNHFLRPLFNSRASSQTKVLYCGTNLFAALTRIAWDRFNFRPAVEMSLGTRAINSIITDEGGSVQVVLDKYGFPGQWSGGGILVDMAHVKLKEMRGEPLAWRPSIEDNPAHVRKDEVWGSASLKLWHEETHGIIFGAQAQF